MQRKVIMYYCLLTGMCQGQRAMNFGPYSNFPRNPWWGWIEFFCVLHQHKWYSTVTCQLWETNKTKMLSPESMVKLPLFIKARYWSFDLHWKSSCAFCVATPSAAGQEQSVGSRSSRWTVLCWNLSVLRGAVYWEFATKQVARQPKTFDPPSVSGPSSVA